MEKQIYIERHNFRKSDFERFVIVSDVSGEHTYVAIMGIKDSRNFSIIFKKTYLTREVSHVYEILNDALSDAYHEYGIEIGRAVIAGAGPVSRKRGYIKLTNVDLTINSQDILNHSLLHKAILINDFEAIGYGLDMLDMKNDVLLLEHVGEDFTITEDLSNNFAAIGAGNGLGVTIAYMDRAKHIHVPLPSEGGHMDFSPQTQLEFELLLYLKEKVLSRKVAHPEYERVLSGKGISSIYDFIRSKNMFPETDATRKIDAMTGVEKLCMIEKSITDPTCNKTIELFVKFYARAARNLALMSECYSGLFIAGSIALRYTQFFTGGLFMSEFEMHDERTDVLRKIPVYMIKNKDVALYGCCNVAVNFYNIM